MKLELDENDRASIYQSLMKYVWESLREETHKIIKEQFKLLVAQEYREIAKEAVKNILEEEKIDLSKMIKNRILENGTVTPAQRSFQLSAIVKDYVEKNLEDKLSFLFENEREFLESVFKDSLTSLFKEEIKKKLFNYK